MSLPRFLLLLICTLLPIQNVHAEDPVAPERAFPMHVRALSPEEIEITFDIKPDYYLYGEKFRFYTNTEGVALGIPIRPQGKHIPDFLSETGDLVETHHGRLSITLPITLNPDQTEFDLEVHSQGCWEGGICYPPLIQTAQINLSTPTAPITQGLISQALLASPATGNDNTTLLTPPPSEPAPATLPESADESGRIAHLLSNASLPLALASFFLFGLLLAFTPCVFPMVPILSGIIVGQGAHLSRARAFSLSLTYVISMALTYAAVGVAAGLSGALLTAALQNVWVLSIFALLFVVLALSMFGFFELQLPAALQSRLSSTAGQRTGGQYGGVALMGILSALIVGPCVAAPLAGALLYIARSGDALLGGLALFLMAIGMGVPLLAVGLAAQSILPKAGPWMNGIKKIFGVLMLGVALWLLSPVLPAAINMLAWALLLIYSGIFLHALDGLPENACGWRRFRKSTGIVLLIWGAALLIGALSGSKDPLQPLAGLRGNITASPPLTFQTISSLDELNTLLTATDRPVMLDFYADWCVSCKEMERFTFTDPEVIATMKKMLLLKADVTASTENDRALLKHFNLFGPPGIIFFDRNGAENTHLRVVGFMPAEQFAPLLQQALQ